METPIWVTILVAAIAIVPGTIAIWQIHHKEDRAHRRQVRADALEGFAELTADLREQLDRERKDFRDEMTREREECERRIDEGQRRITHLESEVADLKRRQDRVENLDGR